MATKRSAEKEEFWRLVLTEQQASGMTIKAFCAQQGLAAHAFSWWKREIKKRDLRRDESQNDSHLDDTQLVPVTVIDEVFPSHERNQPTYNDRSIIEVVSPTGYTLRIESEAPPPYLTGLLDAVTACNAIGGKSC